MKGMVIRMNASRSNHNGKERARLLRTGILGVVAVSLLLFGVSCTRNGDMDGDGTVVDSNVGSVTSDATEKHTDKDTETMTEARTESHSEHGSSTVTTPGTSVPGTTVPGTMVPGTTPNPDATIPAETTEHGTSAVTTVPGTTPDTGARSRYGKG